MDEDLYCDYNIRLGQVPFYLQYPDCSISAGKVAFSKFELHASFQFLGVNLSTIALKASCITLDDGRCQWN